MKSYLIGVDKRGGRSYQRVACEICGEDFHISEDSESGICASCVQQGFPRPRAKVNILAVGKAIERGLLREYRKENKVSQGEIAQVLDITERHYRRLENGQPISKSIRRKIEQKLAQSEQGL